MDCTLCYLFGEKMINDRCLASIKSCFVSDILNGLLLCLVLFFNIEYSIFPQGGKIKLYLCVALCISSFVSYKVKVYDIRDASLLGIVTVLIFLACRAQIDSSGFDFYRMSLTFQFCLTIFSVFVLCQTSKSRLTDVLRFTLLFGVVYVVFLDLFFMGTGKSLANKFICSYLHLYLLVIYTAVRRTEKKIPVYVFSFIAFAFSLMYKCSTAAIACVLFIVLFSFWEFISSYLLSPVVALVTLFISDTILLFSSSILKSQWVNYFIVDVLGKDPSLTGRTGIYSSAIEKFFVYYKGVGLDNNHLASLVITNGGPNLQNGVLDIILSFGWVSVLVLVFLIVYFLFSGKLSIHKSKPFVCFMYSFILISCVEIVFDQMFISFMIIAIYFIPKTMEKSI